MKRIAIVALDFSSESRRNVNLNSGQKYTKLGPNKVFKAGFRYVRLPALGPVLSCSPFQVRIRFRTGRCLSVGALMCVEAESSVNESLKLNASVNEP